MKQTDTLVNTNADGCLWLQLTHPQTSEHLVISCTLLSPLVCSSKIVIFFTFARSLLSCKGALSSAQGGTNNSAENHATRQHYLIVCYGSAHMQDCPSSIVSYSHKKTRLTLIPQDNVHNYHSSHVRI